MNAQKLSEIATLSYYLGDVRNHYTKLLIALSQLACIGDFEATVVYNLSTAECSINGRVIDRIKLPSLPDQVIELLRANDFEAVETDSKGQTLNIFEDNYRTIYVNWNISY